MAENEINVTSRWCYVTKLNQTLQDSWCDEHLSSLKTLMCYTCTIRRKLPLLEFLYETTRWNLLRNLIQVRLEVLGTILCWKLVADFRFTCHRLEIGDTSIFNSCISLYFLQNANTKRSMEIFLIRYHDTNSTNWNDPNLTVWTSLPNLTFCNFKANNNILSRHFGSCSLNECC